MNYDSFNLVDPNNVHGVNLQSIYATRKDTWSTEIFSILSHQGTLPPGEGQQLLKTCRNSGFIFLCHANILHNPYVM